MLNVAEIFRSIDGEVNPSGQGALTTFIRLQGCNLNCSYCDTKQAQDANQIMHELFAPDILKMIPKGKVTITGGEPLLQPDTKYLIQSLLDDDHKISVETNGSMVIPKIQHPNLSWIIDYKLCSQDKMRIDNFWNTTSRDWVKFVIETPSDFQKAIIVFEALKDGGCQARIAFSPVMKNDIMKWGMANPVKWLADQIIENQLWDIVLNLQIHKFIWSDKSEGIQLL